MDIVLSTIRVAIPASLYLFLAVALFLIWCESRRSDPLPSAAVEAAIAAARLVVQEAGGTGMIAGDVLALTAMTSIGRSLENTIILPDSSVSARHAELSFQDGCWWLADLDSTNGTTLNGEAVRERSRIHPQDVIALGKTKLVLEDNPNSNLR